MGVVPNFDDSSDPFSVWLNLLRENNQIDLRTAVDTFDGEEVSAPYTYGTLFRLGGGRKLKSAKNSATGQIHPYISSNPSRVATSASIIPYWTGATCSLAFQ